MPDIRDKIILSLVFEKLKEVNDSCTKTWLKRNIAIPGSDRKFSEDQVLNAIEHGLKNNVLTDKTQGYVCVGKGDYSVSESDYDYIVNDLLGKYYKGHVTSSGKVLISKTARKDTKVAGRWTRPDFTVVTNRTFPYIRQTEFDIITFEVKRPDYCEAIAVFEALAHNSAATRSYVFFPITEVELARNPQGERIREECVRHGIGLFLVNDSYALDEAILLIEAQQRTLNPARCSNFLKQVLEPDELSTLTTWPQ